MTIEDPLVLLVDDLDNDGLLMRIVFERAGFVQPLRFAPGGEEAIAYLRGDDGVSNYKQLGMPAAVLLDLNMPRVNGFQVLAWIRQQPQLRQLRVYILSASSRVEDIERAYALGADSYFVKPSNLAELTHFAQSLLAWLRLSHFAPVPAGLAGSLPGAGGGAACVGALGEAGAQVSRNVS
ncbi:MAG: response regulator [Opitutaceae bacterium]|nr:response regulator [Opitutaceae bacterium]